MLSIGTIQAQVRYHAPYFNRTCYANIPGKATAEVITSLPGVSRVYADALLELDANTPEACVVLAKKLLAAELKSLGFTGKLKFV